MKADEHPELTARLQSYYSGIIMGGYFGFVVGVAFICILFHFFSKGCIPR